MTTVKKNKHAVALGRLGGRSTSEKKKAAVRLNGKLGGRPKKVVADGSRRTQQFAGVAEQIRGQHPNGVTSALDGFDCHGIVIDASRDSSQV